MIVHRLKQWLPDWLHPLLGPVHTRLRLGMDALHRRLDGREIRPRQMADHLRRLGMEPGAVVLVHSAMDAIRPCAPNLSPVELIRLMQSLLGESGTLLMPTFPFRGRQWDHVQGHPVFHVRRTPSKVGLLTEIFRRMPDVQRSLHPTHPVAGWGRHAGAILDDHHRGDDFGPTSPLYRLMAHQGRIIGLGTDMTPFTIQYVAEYRHPRWRSVVFQDQPVLLSVTDASGQTIAYPCHPTRVPRDYSRMDAFQTLFLAEGLARQVRIKGLSSVSIDARDYVDRYTRLLDEGFLLFKPEPDA